MQEIPYNRNWYSARVLDPDFVWFIPSEGYEPFRVRVWLCCAKENAPNILSSRLTLTLPMLLLMRPQPLATKILSEARKLGIP